MSINILGLDIVIPLPFLFSQQYDHIEFLQGSILKDRDCATETQHSYDSLCLLVSYFLSYLDDTYSQYDRVIMLIKTKTQRDCILNEVVPRLMKKKQFNVSIQTMVDCQIVGGQEGKRALLVCTLRDYMMYSLEIPCLPAIKTILYINESDTLDLECQEILSMDLTAIQLNKAIIELGFVKFQPTTQELEEEIQNLQRQMKEPTFDPNSLQWMENPRLVLGLIEYLLGYFKFKQSKPEKKKITQNKKLSEFINGEILQELYLPLDILKQIRPRFNQILKIPKFSEKVPYIPNLRHFCQFIHLLVRNHIEFDMDHKNAFRLLSNFQLKNHDGYVYRCMCLDPKIMFGRICQRKLERFQQKPLQKSEKPILLMINSYSCLQKDFFYSHFKLWVDIKTFVDKETSSLNILSLSVATNAFDVDIKSQDYAADTEPLQIMRSCGAFLQKLCEDVPDGIVVYVSSYRYLHALCREWSGPIKKDKKESEDEQAIFQKMKKSKRIFVETENQQDNLRNYQQFKKQCNLGRGAIFFICIRTKYMDSYDFKSHLSNVVVFLGYPLLNEHDIHTKEKLDYLNQRQKAKDYDYLEQDAMRHVNKLMINVVGDSKYERKVMLFVDARYKMKMVPAWMNIAAGAGNLSISSAIELTLEFLRSANDRKLNAVIKNRIKL